MKRKNKRKIEGESTIEFASTNPRLFEQRAYYNRLIEAAKADLKEKIIRENNKFLLKLNEL